LRPPGKKIRAMDRKDPFLREHAKEITEIIEATREDPENEVVRAEIAAALSASLHCKKMRARSVKDTDLYRLAQAVRQAGGEQECVELVKRAFPRRWSVIFEKYNFAWKFFCRETRPTRGIEEETRGPVIRPHPDASSARGEGSMNQIVRWQYDQLVKELLLLQDHIADPSCPCETGGEMCVRKHLFTIEAYAEETLPMEDNEEHRAKLEKLVGEAKDRRNSEEEHLRGEQAQLPANLLEWARDWRKQFEGYSLPLAES
jgi:hypothetical protein